jgi:thiol-disulfide isomerase/thioredoxin
MIVGLCLVVSLGAAQGVLRSRGAPPVEELVAWEPFEALGDPPYDRRVLLEFSAEWCVPCRRMQVTTFRDPDFVALLEEYDLRPMRVEYVAGQDLEFNRLMRSYLVEGLPGMVLIDRDGRLAPPILGLKGTRELELDIQDAIRDLSERLFWNDPSYTARDGRLRVLIFDRFWLLPSAERRDWRVSPTADFARWCEDHVDLVGDRFRLPPPGAAYYASHGIRSIPTLILLDPEGAELGRFIGADAIEAAPGEIARIAREHGHDLPDPPKPYAASSR